MLSTFIDKNHLRQKHVVMWTSTFNFRKNNSVYTIALPTENQEIQINQNFISKNGNDFTLKVFWHNYLDVFGDKHLELISSDCEFNSTSFSYNFEKCKNVTGFFDPENGLDRIQFPTHYIFLWKTFARIIHKEAKANHLEGLFGGGRVGGGEPLIGGSKFEKPEVDHSVELRSWNEVAHACEVMGAALPSFRRRNELHQFLALLKMPQDSEMFPLEAIFIGLRLNRVSIDLNLKQATGESGKFLKDGNGINS